MERIVKMPDGSGVLIRGSIVPDAWEVSQWRQNGVLERSARPVMRWEEVGNTTVPMNDEDYRAWLCSRYEGKELVKELKRHDEEVEEKRLRNLRRSARRAKTQCRRAIVAEQFDEMLTLTYRENQTDRALCKQHFAAWVRRMKLALGHDEWFTDSMGRKRTRRVPADFRFVAAIEAQERGAMHVHVACHKLPAMAHFKGAKVKSWQVGTMIWRSIVGADNGLCFVGGRSRFGAPRAARMSLAKMAAYVSKYILKDAEDLPSGTNRYHRSLGIPIAKPERMTFYGCTLLDLCNLMYEHPEGTKVHAFKLSKWKDALWFSSESPPDPA